MFSVVIALALAGAPASLAGQVQTGAGGDDAPTEITLREAIERALVYSPAAVSARVVTENAEAGKREAFGDYLPTLNVGSTFANSSNQRFDQTTGQLVSESYTAQVQASYEIFSFGRRIANNRAAGARLDAAIANERDQEFAVALATTQIFFEVAAAQELARVAQQRIDRAQAQLDFAETRLELGTVTRSDVLRAELEVSNAELALLDAEVAFRTGALRLGRQIGVSGEVRTGDAALPETVPDLPELEVLVTIAEREAPPVISAEASVKDWTAQKQTIWTRYAPSLRINGGYDWFDFNFPPTNQSWSFRLTANLPVFDGFSREAALWRNQSQERLAQAQYRDAVIGARVEVEDAWLRIQAADRRVVIADRGLTLAREDLRVQEERYQLGVATIVELQTSQVALADAENAWVVERQNLGLALAQLEAVLGRSLEDITT